MHSEITNGNFLAQVYSTGEVHTSTAGKTITACLLDMTYFPFDHHECIVKFSNWMYSSDQLRLANASYELDLSLYKENSQWTLKQSYMTMEIEVEEDGVYEMVVVTLCKYF